MSFHLDTSDWKWVRLGDVLRRSRTQVDPLKEGVERYVGGQHIDGESITISRWGDPKDGQMGSTFRYVFSPGQVLFVSARPYLRKSGVVGFSGVVADKTYVLDAAPDSGLLQAFLPFVLAAEPFVKFASAEATGSMNPRLLWGGLQRYTFALPPVAEQKRLSDLLWAVERHREAAIAQVDALQRARIAYLTSAMGRSGRDWTHGTIGDVAEVVGGGTPATAIPEYWDGDIPWLTPGDLTSRDGQVIKDTERYISDQGLEHSAARLLPERAVLVTTRATIGVVGLVGAPLATNQGFQSLVCSEAVIPEYMLRWVQVNRGQLIARAGGSTFLEIGAGAVKSIPIGVPPLDEQRRVVERAAATEVAIEELKAQIRALTQVRAAALGAIFGSN